MKKLILLFLLIAILALSTLGFADTVQIGTGTSTAVSLPIYANYAYTYSQQIYLQTQINKSGNITKLRFFYVSGAITNSKDWVIYMGNTIKTSFSSTTDWVPLENLTQVFAGDVSSYLPATNNWMEIPLTTPFNYNNTDNLVIAVDENTPGSASMTWGSFGSGSNTGIYYNNNSTNPDPASPPTANSRTATINRIQLVFPNTSAPLTPTLLFPANGCWAFANDVLSWLPTLGAGDPTAYDVYLGTSSDPPLVSSNQTATTYTPTLGAGNTYYWKVVAKNEFGNSPASEVWSFKTPTTSQLAESFENTTFPPAGWSNPGSWSRSTTYAKHGRASASKTGSTDTQYILSTPKVTITSTSTLDFWTLCSATVGILQIVYSSDMTTWIQLGSNITFAVANTWYHKVIDLSSLDGNNYYLGFRTAYSRVYYIDYVVGPEITPEAPDPVTLTSPANGATMVSIRPTFTWTPSTTGGVPTAYKLYCDTNNPPTTPIGTTTNLTYTPTTPLQNGTLYYWTVKAENSGGSSTATPFSFTTIEQGYTIIGTGTSTQRQPFGILWGYERSAALYTNAQIGDYGILDKVAWDCAISNPASIPYKIYAMQTTDIAITAMTWDSFTASATLVDQGTHTFATLGWHTFELDNPFPYVYGNLIVAVETNYGGTGTLSFPSFYYTIGTGGCHQCWYHDNTPPTGNGNPNNFLPNIMLHISEFPSGPPNPVTLTYPANGATGLPQVGFNLTWTPAITGGVPDYYAVYMSRSDETIYEGEYYWETPYTSFNPVTQGGITFNYLDRWYWTVEAVNGDGSAAVVPPYWFVIEADPRVPLPYTQDFGTDGIWPLNWTQTYSGGITSNRWSLSNTNNAGGTPYEMKATYQNATGISRLISLPVNTADVSAMTIRFRTYYEDYGAGVTTKVQYSHDLTTWYDTSWSIISGGGDVSGLKTILISNLNSPITYIAWTLDGNHYQFDYWYIDDVTFSLPPNHDVAPVSWDVPTQVVGENTLVIPKATVINNGLNTESFTVTCTIGDTYTDTQTVSGLAMGMTQQVTFASFTPALCTASLVTVTTSLSMDEVTENDTLQDVLICLPLDTEGVAENVSTDYFVQFNLATPGTMYNLPTPFPAIDIYDFMAGADWANGKWLSCRYDDGTLTRDNFWEINPMTGAMTQLGEMGAAIMGIAYDDNNNILYGTDGYDLYTMNVNTGVATYVDSLWYNLEGTSYSLANIGGLMIDIAYDNFTDTFYGIDLGNDCLWTINPTTRELTLIGFMGIDINYAQDAAFDQDNGLLFLAGYAGGGALYWIDTEYGGAYKVGNFPGNAEVAAFAIPYGLISVPEVTIASNGTISWAPVNGAIKYSIYKATDPYGTYSWYADAFGTSWTDPSFTTNAMAFYKVTAVGGMRNVYRQEMRYSNPIQHKGNLNIKHRYETGLANQSLMPTKSKPNK
jgi:hypothetical protein